MKIKSFKIRIYPNKTQEKIIKQTLGSCRWIYNEFIAINIHRRENNQPYMNGYDFSKMITEEKKNPLSKFYFLNDISSKAIHEAFMDAHQAYTKFMKKEGVFPKFKSRKKNPVDGYFFVGDNVKFKNKKVVLPVLGKVRITETKYIPSYGRIIGGTIKYHNGKYYAVFRVEYVSDEIWFESKRYKGIGIDVGIKNFASIVIKEKDITKDFTIKSFVNDAHIICLENRVKEYQRIISNKMEVNYGRLLHEYMDKHHEEPSESYKNIMKGGSYSNKCRRLQEKINNIKEKISNYKKNKIDCFVNMLVRLKPKYITVESLSIKEMLENDSSHKLHKYIAESLFGYFFRKLEEDCHDNFIELRKAYKYFASSKTCSICGNKKEHLSLSERVYHCHECGNIMDRDLNASYNLVNLKKYKIVY